MPTWLIWVIVIIVVLVVIATLVVMLTGKRRTEHRRARAEELRRDASAQASGLPESQRQAEDLRAKADLAKSESQRAEEHAATAEQSHQVDQAGYEDKLREADRLDPDVDHKSREYEPDVWSDERSDSEPAPTTEASAPTDSAGTTERTDQVTPDSSMRSTESKP